MDQEKEFEINQAEWENPANWRWGIFYVSERDTRVWVPKRSMLGRNRSGGTFNMAKPAARKFVASFVLFLLGILVIAAMTNGN